MVPMGPNVVFGMCRGRGHNSHDGGTAVRVILELRSPTARADDEVEQQISLATFTYLYPVSVCARGTGLTTARTRIWPGRLAADALKNHTLVKHGQKK